ncbi:MAG: metallophosphoesterase family protein [Oscillospiraceae bacterium]|jgi:hypothetical protein|nr:metallophosphoesterase family protein [Oscillospiraceae bacterium]
MLDRIMLSICGNARTEMAVTWRFRAPDFVPGSEAFALLRPIESAAWVRVEAVTAEIATDESIHTHAWARFCGLAPGKRYAYTVGSINVRSIEYIFCTEPENLAEFDFLLISDQQRSQPWENPSYDAPRRMIDKMLSAYPDIRFILTAGDNCDNGQNEIQWNAMFGGFNGIIESLPHMMCTGNHDNRGFAQYLPSPAGKFYLDHADLFDAQFERCYPQNGPVGFRGENYSFDYGDAHFTIMGINAPQTVADWAYADIQGSNKRWKLGCYHFPIYPLMPEGQNDDAYPWLRRPIEEGSLDVLFSGHEHSFGRTYPMRGEEMGDKPSEGFVNYICGATGGGVYISNARKMWHAAFYPQEINLPMAHLVHVTRDTLTVTAVLADGRIADEFILDKARDAIHPVALAPTYLKTKLSYKGDMVNFGGRGVFPFCRDGIWMVPAAVLLGHIGGAVQKSPGSVSVAAYKKEAVFAEGVDGCVRGDKGELYVPANTLCRIFGMKWQYAARNNILNFDHPSEDKAFPQQM